MSQHHDPVHPDSDHLSAETLADLALGLLDDESAGNAVQHLQHCAACAALQTDLSDLSGLLADLPVAPMPDAVWDQLADRLAAEPVETPAGAAAVVPIESRKRRWGRPGIGVVAGAAGVALLGAIIVPSVMGGDSNDSSPLAGEGSTADRSETVPVTAFEATRSGTRYQAEELPEQVTELVAARTTFSPTATAAPSSSPQPEESGATAEPSDDMTSLDSKSVAPMVTDPAAAQACLEGYLGVTGVTPLAIDIGVWQGEPAAVIVLPATEPQRAEVWVIDPDCSTGTDDPLIYWATVDR
jgi:hypothetical protein